MRWSHARRGLVCCLLIASSWTSAAAQAPGESDEEVARQRQIVERFVTVLDRNPRRGTALDKIYGFHVENGSLEAFVAQLRERVAGKPDDGAGWLILGLVESQRGRDAAAVEALTKAMELRATDPLAAYYLGQSLVLVGQPEKAAAAFEEAIGRKPAQADLLEIFQSLGRVHQRAARTQEALAVWNRLEKLFPGDPRVQEQIAVTLVEEGQSAEALPRYEALAKATTDDYRRTVYRMEAADLKVRLSRASEGIADLEQLLGRLNPESWLFREVRRKVEEVFLRTDDQDGLAKYYVAWLAKNPEDVEAMARLARVLARQTRVPEAQVWLDKALQLAPSRKDLRLAFIEQLVDDQRYAEAIGQYAELDKADPNNPDYLRDWGKLILRDGSRNNDERQAEAEKIWRRLLAARPTDPLIATQVADLFRHAEMRPQALELYQKAVELAPASPQYREYLGEYFHILKRPDEALATWRKMAEGEQRTTTNVARLAEVLSQFGYLQQALPEIAAACELDPRDFALAVKAAELQLRAEQHEAALGFLARAERLAQNDEERELVLGQQIKTHTLQNNLADLATSLAQQTSNGQATHQQWFLLARYREALHEYADATKVIAEALKLDPNNIPSLAAAARIAEQAGELKTAADLNRKLAIVDRRSRSTYLEHIAGLETQLGRIEEALAAGRELIAATPGNVETYQFFADLCFRLGRTEDGLTALRRATRVNPSEPSLLMALGAALTSQFRADEAIELYWQAYEKERELDDKLTVIARLTELYLQTNHFDKLLERLERGRRDADQRREMTICLAQAYQSAGDYGMARQELERLLHESTRDTQLLLQLSKLAESEADLAAAVKYQEQLAKLAPGPESEYRLATLLSRAGDNQQAGAILVSLAVKENDRSKLLRNIDSLLGSGQEDTAMSILESKVRENPSDWELLYRHGVALAKRNPTEAARGFQAILNQSLTDEEPATAAKLQQRRTGGAATAPAAGIVPASYTGPLYRLTYGSQARSAVGLDDQRLYFATSARTIWMPLTFGQARMASVGWLYRFATDQRKAEDFVAERRKRIESSDATVRELWDWMYLQTIRAESADMRAAARRLAELGDLPGQAQFMELALSRSAVPAQVIAVGPQQERSEPLEPGELELVLRSFKAMQKGFESQPQGLSVRFPVALLAELRRAGRTDEADRLYSEWMSQTQTPRQLTLAIQLAADSGDMSTALMLLDRLAKKDLQTGDAKTPAARSDHVSLGNLILSLASAKRSDPKVLLTLLDHFLDYHIAWANQRRDNPLVRLAASGATSRPIGSITISTGGTLRRVAFTYPAPNAYYDVNALNLLRTIFEQFKQQDLVSDFVKHLEQRAAAATGDRIFALLSVAYAQSWNEDQEAALQTLAVAMQLVPSDSELRLETARLHVQAQQFDEALSLVDSVTPLDQRTLQQREMLALDLAVRLGDHQRAREAAQRLFGLRLDAETQVNLAGQMRRLGMADEANAILARSQRQAGSRLPALSALMTQYREQGQMDQATQVAQRILRATRTPPTAQAAQGISSPDSQYRNLAIQCLSQTGKLKEIVTALEEQIQRTPTATQLYETLAEYYQLSGDVQKSLDLTAKLVELKPDDADIRYRYAQDLYRRQKFAEACDQYKVILKKQPQLVSRRYFEVTQAFQRAQREAELVEVLGEIDLRSLGQPYMVTNLISNMMRSPQSRAAGLALFRKAWEAFPAERLQLTSYLSGDDVWKLPEVIGYAKQSLLPTADLVRRDPWYGIYGGVSMSSDGRVTTSLSRLLTSATQNGGLDTLREEIAAKLAEQPTWLAGPVVLALIDLRQKKPIDTKEVMKPLLDTKSPDYRMMYIRWIVGQELNSVPAERNLAIQLYELASQDGRNTMRQFQFSPAAALVRAYQQAGRKDDARLFLQRAVREELTRDTAISSSAFIRVDSMNAVAKLFEELDAPADALKTYREVLTNPLFNDGNQGIIISGQPDYYKQQARQGMQTLLGRLGNQPPNVIALLTPTGVATPGTGVIDLMLGVGEINPGPLRPIESPIAKVVNPAGLSPESVAKVDAHLKSLVERFPRDLSVRIVTALFALKSTDAAKKQESLAQLAALVEELPLEELNSKQRPNSRQRTEAAQQVGLWLVARECLKIPDHREIGQKLAERAITAAQRQVDTSQLTTMLYERGRLALNAGDRASAERQWNELIDLALVQPRTARPTTVGNAPRGVPGSPLDAASAARGRPQSAFPTEGGVVRGAPAGSASAPPARTGPLPATASQFALAASIAQGAAEHDLVALSLRAMKEALSGGLPVRDPLKATDPITAARNAALLRQAAMPGGATPLDPEQQAIVELTSRMWQLSVIWKQRQFPPAEVCQLFESLVFPAARPSEIALCDPPPTRDLGNPRGMGRLLVDWAVRAGRGDELARQIAQRQASPTDAMAGHLLLTQYHVARREISQARAQLEAALKQLESSKLPALAELAAQATAVAMAEPQLVAAAAPLFSKLAPAVQNRVLVASGGNPQVPVTVLTRLDLQRGDLAAAKSTLARYVEVRKEFYARNSSETNVYYQRLELAFVANELSRAGDLATTLEALAEFADLPVPRDRDASVSVALWHLARQARKLPPQARYELLRDWTLPAKGRGIPVRIVADFDAGQPIPSVFLAPGDAPYEAEPRFGPLSNLTLLIEAAKEAGKLDELWQTRFSAAAENTGLAEALAAVDSIVKGNPAAAPAVPAAVARGQAFAALMFIAKGDHAVAATRIEAMAARIREVVPVGVDRSNRPPLPAPGDYLVAHAALAVPELAAPAHKLAEVVLEQARKTNQKELIAHLGYDLAQAAIRVAPSEDKLVLAPKLKWWQPATGPQTTVGTYPPALWSIQAGHLVHHAGCEYDALYFKQPLAGEFEFSYETYAAYFEQCDVGYAGLFCFLQYNPRNTVIWPIAQHEQLLLPPQTEQGDAWNRVTVKVSPASVRYLVNDRLAYEDTSPSRTSPWLHLHVLAPRQPKMRNLRLAGSPIIPSEIPLIDGDRLEGWNAGFYGETLPKRLTKDEPATSSGAIAGGEAGKPPGPDWTATGGVVEGRIDPAAPPQAQSRIFYHRPLAGGERVRYQFFYQPGGAHVHPTIGRTALLLEPAGVRLHWMTSARDLAEPILVEPGNAVDDPSCRRGLAALPLKANDWNDVELSIAGDTVALSLNGVLVYERPIEATSDRRFGLFHFKEQTAAKVRNIVLRGDWSDKLLPADMADLLTTAPN